MSTKKKTPGTAQATLDPPGQKIWPSSPAKGKVSCGAPAPAAHLEGIETMETEEIIRHVVHGQLTEHNPRPRKISPALQPYVNDALRRQKQLLKEIAPLQEQLNALPEEQRNAMYKLLQLNSQSYALARERELVRRAIPLIEALRQQSRRLRRDRTRAFDFIEKLRAKIRDIEYWGLGPIPEPSQDHWPENQGEDDLREPGGG
ncbi:hypothetical protein [Deinococcus marmoris]|uniref:hypothetical protein n=1 Tax=Deinococcus marmoris TaxID=249408 RepID=UPI00049565D2|nr:hypothetical protein [Deinococcus marmoris]